MPLPSLRLPLPFSLDLIFMLRPLCIVIPSIKVAAEPVGAKNQILCAHP